MREIVKGKLYQGDRDDAVRVAGQAGTWRTYGLRGVINAAGEINVTYDPALPVLILPVSETEPTPEAWWLAAAQFSRMCNGHVFVHCAQGKNRSNAVCAAILLDAGWALDEALKETNQALPPALLGSLRQWAQRRGG